MPQKPDVKALLETLSIPKQFSNPPILKAWFMEGAQDALEGRPASNETDMARRLGQPVSDAYQSGFQAARVLKRPLA
jgi:hypothetical protein